MYNQTASHQTKAACDQVIADMLAHYIQTLPFIEEGTLLQICIDFQPAASKLFLPCYADIVSMHAVHAELLRRFMPKTAQIKGI